MMLSVKLSLLLLVLAAVPVFSQYGELRRLQSFPDFISVQENNNETFYLDEYYAGFNLSFSLVPPKMTSAASASYSSYPQVKTVIPLKRKDVFPSRSASSRSLCDFERK